MDNKILRCMKKDEKVKILNKHTYALIGGHNNLYTKLRGMMSQLSYIEPGRKRFNIKILKNVDYVIFCYDYLSHNVAKKIYESSFRYKMIYIKGTNIEQIIDKLYMAVEE